MRIYGYILIAAIVTACGTKAETEVGDKPLDLTMTTPLAKSGEMDRLMSDIDLVVPSLERVESLTYLKEDGSMMVVTAYLDQNGLITKIKEERADVSEKIRARFEYYSNGGVLFASRKMSEKIKDNQAYYSEEISFYNSKGEVLTSKERVSDYEEYIDQAKFHEVKNVKHSQELALKVLRQEGQFVTTFQGFVEQGGYQFLIVGEDVPGDGFTASLAIQEDGNTIRYLKKEGRNALGKELKVNFEKIVDQQGYTIQILRDVALVERR